MPLKGGMTCLTGRRVEVSAEEYNLPHTVHDPRAMAGDRASVSRGAGAF
jgi:hypothetical protein